MFGFDFRHGQLGGVQFWVFGSAVGLQDFVEHYSLSRWPAFTRFLDDGFNGAGRVLR
jgi:hypothetical protein